MGLIPGVRALVSKYFDAFRFLPLPAVTGVFVALFGLGVGLKIHFLSFGILLYLIPVIVQRIDEIETIHKQTITTLGATKWQTIRKIVLPNSMNGILTGGILAVSRGAGEVAPILFTGAAYYMADLPKTLHDQFMDLGYHVFILSTQSPDIEKTRPIQYGTSLVLIALVLGMNLAAILLRAWLQKRHAH